MKHTLYTIGYEGLTAARFIDKLKAAGIQTLVDVRAVPLSRKPGFSKNMLAAQLRENGIDYVGLKNLGTPAAGRDAARSGKISLMRRIFEKHMTTPAAKADLARAIEIARAERACLLCFEMDAARCHRSVVAKKIQEKTGQKVENLRAGMDGELDYH